MLLTSNSLHLLICFSKVHNLHACSTGGGTWGFLSVDLQDKYAECTFTLWTAYSQAMLTENVCCSSRSSRREGVKGTVAPFLLLPLNSRCRNMERMWGRARKGQGREGIYLAIHLEKQLWVNNLYHTHSHCGQLEVAPLKKTYFKDWRLKDGPLKSYWYKLFKAWLEVWMRFLQLLYRSCW